MSDYLQAVADAQRWELAHADMTLQARDALIQRDTARAEMLKWSQTAAQYHAERDVAQAEVARLRAALANFWLRTQGLSKEMDAVLCEEGPPPAL